MSDRLVREYERAADAVADAAARGMGQVSTRRNIEQRYAQAYQALVRAGLAPQIRGKYR